MKLFTKLRKTNKPTPNRLWLYMLILTLSIPISLVIIINIFFGTWEHGEITKYPNIIIDITTFFGFVSIVVTLYALGATYAQGKRLKEISDAISTRYIGEFPTHIRDVVTLVNKTRRKLDVLVDCGDYGSFSDPELCRELYNALLDFQISNSRANVRVLVVSSTEEGALFTRSSRYFGRDYESVLLMLN